MINYLILILLLVVIVILFWLGRSYATINKTEKFSEESYNEGYNAGCDKGYEQAIKKACEWIHTALYLDHERSIEHRYATLEELLNDFKKAMKGGDQ